MINIDGQAVDLHSPLQARDAGIAVIHLAKLLMPGNWAENNWGH